MDDNVSGPQFIKTMIPILDELKKRNGIGKSNEVIESVIINLNITDDKLFEKYKSGQTRIYNQICWARNYLVEAGFISKEKRGIWELTEKGKNTILVEKDLIPLFKSVQDKFKNNGEDIDFEKEESLECSKENFWNVIERTLEKVGEPLTAEEIWNKAKELNTLGTFKTSGKTPWATIGAYCYHAVNSGGEHSNFIQTSKNPPKFFLRRLLKQDANFIGINENKKSFGTYTKENALSELFIETDKFETILTTLKRKKNIILQGSPGVGKTFFAKRLAYTMIGFKDSSKLNMIQFHQSYSYEDFMQGFRPTEKGKFLLKNGIFYKFCQRAAKDAGNPYVFIIDEINRGNLSKIFGELMMLIESDKRGEDFSIPLTYSKDETETFYVPENVYVIGTMNTADRSLAIVDYALRRRFSFIDIEPAYNKQSFLDYLEKNKISKELIGKINFKFANLNQLIEKDNRLGKGFRIGHSYFSVNLETDNQIEWYKSIVQMEIAPLLAEYWFDDEIQATGQIEKLLEI